MMGGKGGKRWGDKGKGGRGERGMAFCKKLSIYKRPGDGEKRIKRSKSKNTLLDFFIGLFDFFKRETEQPSSIRRGVLTRLIKINYCVMPDL